MIYLDNSATTPPAPEVIERMNDWRAKNFANASSAHRSGQQARVELEDARDHLAAMLSAAPRDIVFTSGGTEANNFAIKGFALKAYASHGVWPTIITSKSEHHALLHPVEFLARLGAPVRYVNVDTNGRVTPDALRAALGSRDASALLVSIMHANNETGTINPIAELAAIAHEAGGIFHTDAVQTFGKIPLDVEQLGVDMLSISAHKIHGPKGIGALYIGNGVDLEPLLHGGAQERNRRGGTESVELVVGFEAALLLAGKEIEENGRRMAERGAELRSRLSAIEGIRFVTPDHGALPGIVNVTFDDAANLDGEALIVGMDLRGIAVSNGSACTSGSIQPSHVLSAMGLPPEQAKAAVRFSLSRYTTSEDVVRGVEGLVGVVAEMRGPHP